MRILIIAHYFPPKNSVASLRPYSWAQFWAQSGHDVTVLTTEKVEAPEDLKIDHSRFRVLTLPWIPKFLQRLQQGNSAKSQDTVVTNTASHTPGFIRLAKRALLSVVVVLQKRFGFFTRNAFRMCLLAGSTYL
jgi:hypothetical protein